MFWVSVVYLPYDVVTCSSTTHRVSVSSARFRDSAHNTTPHILEAISMVAVSSAQPNNTIR
ncbi:hypothetical protein DOTSEDRAFT_74782 [Dothistroma septosporum NZE10]|uniref:Uncharacterized protein n=1 Tax=Dothistroma septosporum (strain NZE10 / CBS 128990) TaxID=675120 RepID=N1PEJ4_DOTSN|nr:hypothetical protein DOTSEDRAFT_74782 [Dothistroma septosporum NZE10]